MNNPWFLLLLFVLSLFQMVLLHVIPLFTFFDEAITIWALYIIITNYKFNANKRFDWMLIIMCIITIYGVICNYHFNYQTNIIPILNDIGNCFKVFITYIGASLYYCRLRKKKYDTFINQSGKLVLMLIAIMFPLCIANLFFDFGMRQDVRHGIPSFTFIYGGAAKLSEIFTILMLFFTIYLSKQKSLNIKNRTFIVMAFMVWAMTMRTRAILFIIWYLIMYWLIIYKKQRIKINIWTISVGVILFLLVCLDQIGIYMEGESSARFFLLTNGIKTMIDYFPFGCGFGTYGTDVAAKYYSPLYVEYGMDKVYGLSPEDPKFSHDSYWPAIMGQFGFLGIVLFIILIGLLFLDIMKKSRGNRYKRLLAIFICFTQLVESLAGSIFFNFLAVSLFFYAAIIFSQRNSLFNLSIIKAVMNYRNKLINNKI